MSWGWGKLASLQVQILGEFILILIRGKHEFGRAGIPEIKLFILIDLQLRYMCTCYSRIRSGF